MDNWSDRHPSPGRMEHGRLPRAPRSLTPPLTICCCCIFVHPHQLSYLSPFSDALSLMRRFFCAVFLVTVFLKGHDELSLTLYSSLIFANNWIFHFFPIGIRRRRPFSINVVTRWAYQRTMFGTYRHSAAILYSASAV